MAVVLATAGYDQSIKFWDAGGTNVVSNLSYTDSQINTICIRPGRQHLAVGGNPHIRFFDLNQTSGTTVYSQSSNDNQPASFSSSFEGHTGNILSLGFQKESRWMYSGSEDGTVKIWDLKTPTAQRTLQCGSPVTCVTLHPNQAELLVGLQNGSVRFYDLAENKSKEITPTLTPDVPIRSVSIRSDGKHAAVANNKGQVHIIKFSGEDTSNYEVVTKPINAHKSCYVLKVLYTPNGKTLVTCASDNSVKTWEVDKDYAQGPATLVGHTKWVWDCVVSKDSNLLITASSDTSARLWDLAGGDCLKQYNGHRKAVSCVALSDS